jgi:hypothetical protein
VAFGIGALGLEPDKFWMLTFAELELLARHYRNEKIEGWRQFRWLATVIVNINSKRSISPDKLLKLPEDEEREAQVMTRERFEQLKRIMSN